MNEKDIYYGFHEGAVVFLISIILEHTRKGRKMREGIKEEEEEEDRQFMAQTLCGFDDFYLFIITSKYWHYGPSSFCICGII